MDIETEIGAEIGHHSQKLDPVHVIIDGDTRDRPTSPEQASWTGYSLAGTEPAFQLLPQDKRRRKARILCNGAAATDYVIIGQQNSVNNGAPRGFFLYAGSNVTVESQAAVWCVPANNAVTVSVLDERYVS